ncbi:MAG: hypothetical protein NZL91_05195 [Thermoflexales bacterium]|nr:hypothetical protein [Thermoflexales bacterium]
MRRLRHEFLSTSKPHRREWVLFFALALSAGVALSAVIHPTVSAAIDSPLQSPITPTVDIPSSTPPQPTYMPTPTPSFPAVETQTPPRPTSSPPEPPPEHNQPPPPPAEPTPEPTLPSSEDHLTSIPLATPTPPRKRAPRKVPLTATPTQPPTATPAVPSSSPLAEPGHPHSPPSNESASGVSSLATGAIYYTAFRQQQRLRICVLNAASSQALDAFVELTRGEIRGVASGVARAELRGQQALVSFWAPASKLLAFDVQIEAPDPAPHRVVVRGASWVPPERWPHPCPASPALANSSAAATHWLEVKSQEEFNSSLASTAPANSGEASPFADAPRRVLNAHALPISANSLRFAAVSALMTTVGIAFALRRRR